MGTDAEAVAIAINQPGANEPLYETITVRLIEEITTGRIAAGGRLPSVRELQRTESVSKNTAISVLRLLEQRGYAVAKPRSGYFASSPHTMPVPSAVIPGAEPRKSELSPASTIAPFVPDGALNMGEAILDSRLLPIAALNRASRSVLSHDNGDVFAELAPVVGAAELRQAIAHRMRRSGTEVVADDIIVTSGATESVALALEQLCKPGALVAVECPSYFGTRLYAQVAKLNLLEVSTDPIDGLSVNALDKLCQRSAISAVVVSANVQNPTGASMPLENRQRLLELAHQYDFWIIEDDVFGDYARYSGVSSSSIKALETAAEKADQRVVYCSSFSKIISPGIRCGWVVPGPHYQAMRERKAGQTLGAPLLNQMAIAKYLGTASVEQHLRSLVKTIDATRLAAVQAVAESFVEGTQAAVPRYGFLLWIKLPAGVSAETLADEAEQAGIFLMRGLRFGAGREYEQYLRLNVGRRWSAELADAIAMLGCISRKIAAAR